MAAAKDTAVQFNIPVTLTRAAHEFVQANSQDGNVATTLSIWCDYFLDRQARGGLMLEPEDHDYLASLVPENRRFKDSRTMVHLIEKGLRRDEGQFTYLIKVDPAHAPVLMERAKDSGLTATELVDGVLQYIFASGMIYDFTPGDGRAIPFTANMLAATAALLEKKNIDSADVAGLIAEDRFLPVTREVKAQMQKLMPNKVDFDSRDLGKLLKELEKLRLENKSLKTGPRQIPVDKATADKASAEVAA